MIPFTDSVLCIKNFVCFHLMVLNWYHTEAMIEYIGTYLEEYIVQKDVFSRFRTSKSTIKVSEALKKQLALDMQYERESDTAWINLSVATKCRRVDDDKMEIESEIAQHLVHKSDFNFVKRHLLAYFCDHIHQLANLLNVSSELPEKGIMDLKPAYQQLNCHEAAFQILRTKACMEDFQYRELNANGPQQCRIDDMSSTKYLSNNRLITHDQKSRPLRTWPSGVQCQMGSYTITLFAFQEIGQLHRLHRSGSVIQSSQQCTMHSVQHSSNSSAVFSME